MANVYVRSGAGGAGTGADWANAYTTLAAALTAKAAGDDFWVSEDHAETQASAISLTPKGTASSPNRIICVNHSGTVPPVSADIRATATVSTTGNNSISFESGVFYCEGITFSAGNSTGTASILIANSTNTAAKFVNCGLKLNSTGASSRITLNPAGFIEYSANFDNCALTFAAVGQSINTSANTRSVFSRCTLAGSVPTTLLSSFGSGTQLTFRDMDLSSLDSGKNLSAINSSAQADILFENCKIGASVTKTTGNVSSAGAVQFRLLNCDSGNTNYKYSKTFYPGTISHEATIVRTGGATDGTTPISRKMVTTANSKIYSPLESDPIEAFINSTSSTTITVPIITDNVTLKDTEAWIEVEYLGTASFPQGVIATCRAADVLAAGANQPTDSGSTWTTTGLGTPVKQSLSVTFTPASKGPIRVRVFLAKASTTMYYDPTVIASSGRAWMATAGHINEGPAGTAGVLLNPIGGRI